MPYFHTAARPQIWLLMFKAISDLLQLCNLGSDCCKKSCVRKSCERCPLLGPPPLYYIYRSCICGQEVWILPSVLTSAMPQVCLCLAMYLDDPVLTCLPGLTSDRPLCCGFAWWSVVNPAYHHWTWPFPITRPDLTLACSDAAGLCPLSVRSLPLPALLSPSAPGLPGATHHCCSLAQNKHSMHFCLEKKNH